ncbi:MAG: DsrE family protein [Flavisolibacter sp.]|jgi:intracellular sulfur oxidation DsrE/DsrF family protein|nr:DsrE family protein [Flavisolibacter sp.]
MRKLCFLAAFLITNFVAAAQSSYSVVFDITSGDTSLQKSLVRWLRGISDANPEAKLQVVLYGQSLPMVMKEKSVVAMAVTELARKPNIRFTVCALALKRHNIQPSELITGVVSVPDGIHEIVARQGEGFGYIKVSN